jgi:hypothetical protein
MISAIVMLLLVLVTTSIVSGLLARYTTEDNTGSVSARVATFKVSGTGFSETFNLGVKMNPGDKTDKTFQIKNDSEVTVAYTVKLVNTTKNLPLKIKVGSAAAVSLDSEYTYTNTLNPNGATSDFDFSLVWDKVDNDLVYSGMLDNVAVSVIATQVD